MSTVLEWENVEAEKVGLSSNMLKELDNALNFQLGFIHGVVVARKGSIAYEKYFQGYGPNDRQDLTSVTHAIMSALIGIAIDKGYIAGVDQKVIDYFPEAAAKASDLLKRTLTIKHLLTMTAPYPWKGRDPLDRIRRQKNWTMFILEMIGKKGKLGDFHFSLFGPHLLSVILTRSTGMSTREFANEHLFRPLGIQEFPDQTMKSFSKDDVLGKGVTGWIKDPQDYNIGGWGLTLTPRELARFGMLYVNRGKWEDKQIIPEQWIDESLFQHLEDYGYLWWLRQDGDLVTNLAVGIGGTYLYCIPQKELVVAVVSKVDKMIIDRWELMRDYIIPALVD